MILCLDIGNTHLYGGVFLQKALKLTFRYPTKLGFTSDVLGLFLKQVLRENGCQIEDIDGIVLCSVVPGLDYTVRAACKKYFGLQPVVLSADNQTALQLDIDNPLELGADRIANAIGAMNQFPATNLIIVDFGTATTLCAIRADKHYLGGAILPGFKLAMESLAQNTAKLAAVDINRPATALGKCTSSQLQAGIYYAQLGAIQTIRDDITQAVFTDQAPLLLSTGGYAHLFQAEQLFDHHLPDLVLHGLRRVWQGHTP